MTRTPVLLIAALSLALSLFSPALEAQTIYKWVDENGTVHYGERPPEGVEAEPVSVSSPKVGTSQPNETYTDPGAAAQRRAREAEEQQQQIDLIAEQQGEAARIAAACESHRKRLEELVPRPKILLQNEDGTSRMLGDEERLQMIEESRQFIEEYCGDS